MSAGSALAWQMGIRILIKREIGTELRRKLQSILTLISSSDIDLNVGSRGTLSDSYMHVEWEHTHIRIGVALNKLIVL